MDEFIRNTTYRWIAGVVVAALIPIVFFIGRDDHTVRYIPPKNDTIVAFGDSLVAGVGAESGNGFVDRLEDMLDRRIVNLGVPGDTTASGLLRIDEVLEYDPGIVLLLLGGNDALRRIEIEETRRNLEAILTRLYENETAVVLVAVRGKLLSDPYADMYAELSQTYETALVPNILEGILLRPALTDDQIHPNDEGYTIVAERVYEVVAPLLDNKH